MVDIIKNNDRLILTYSQDFDDREDWVVPALQNGEDVTFKKTFTFNREQYIERNGFDVINDEDYVDDSAEDKHFLLATKEGEYFKVLRGVVTDRFDIYLHQDMVVDISIFIVDVNVSIFKNLESLLTTDIYIGGTHPSAIPESIYDKLLQNFPTAYEKKRYVEARVCSILRDFVDGMKDGEKAYHQYLNKKTTATGSGLKKVFRDQELEKYQTILEKLESMLNSEDGYSEKKWQEEILQILLLLYPKYISVFREVPIRDKNIQEKYVDYLLIDSTGYIDIVEIKRPFDKCIVTENKYRNNFIPLRELSGTIMQIEKYIFYLNRWGAVGETFLNEKYKNELPENFEIKITNPGGIIIMGRDNNLSAEQKADFEVVKRKYKNVFDIITYDNLIHRLKTTIEQIRKL